MPIEFSCAQCGKQLRTPDETAGKQAKCPQCGAVMQIPQPEMFTSLPSATNPVSPFPPSQPAADEFNFNPYQSPQATGSYRRAEAATRTPLASLGARLGGAILDGLISLAAGVPGFVMLFMAIMANPDRVPDNAGTVQVVMAFPIPSVIAYGGMLIVGIVNWVMISQSGQSIGKKIVGTRIVKVDGSLPGFAAGVALRAWVPAVIQAIPCVGAIFGLLDVLFIFGSERRCIHDQIAGTIVVQA